MTNYVTVEPTSKVPVELVFELKTAAEWAISVLMPKIKTLDVTLEFVKIEELGYCEISDGKSRNPREFTIEINQSLKKSQALKTLFHEMTHVQQMATNKLRYVRDSQLWLENNHDKTPYWEQPWEVEARFMEKKLYSEFKKINKKF